MGDTSGEAIAPAAAKDSLGRTLFRRPQRDHQGKRADPTAFEALKRAAAGEGRKPPTKTDMDILFGENQSEVRILRDAGLSKEQIYEYLNDR